MRLDIVNKTQFRPTTMGAGAAVMGGNPRKLIVYTLLDHQFGHMIVEGNMTDEDEETFWLAAGYTVEASSVAPADDEMIGDDTDWQPSQIESD